MMMNSEELLRLAEEHATRLAEDIKLARVRDEHIRVTARANEARHLATLLRELFTNSDT